jgi:alpha-tubulin suppressor-like RCC1 family protein
MGRRSRNLVWRLMIVGLVAAASVPIAGLPAAAAEPGEPYTWGSNDSGELGDGTTVAHFEPEPVPGLDDVVDLHGGRQHVVALRQNGTVVTWGANNFGQLGVSGGMRTSATAVPGVSNVIAVETGHYHSLALLANGTVLAWGYNVYGQLGDGTTTSRSAPQPVSGISDAVAIAAGRNMSYAVRENGTVWAWGLNADGQIGDGSTTDRTTPVRVGSLTNIVEIAGGRDHGLAVTGTGAVWAWGDNYHGQIGDGTRIDRTAPVMVLTGATDVIAGAHHSYALTDEGTVRSWGRNYRGALGIGVVSARRTEPQLVPDLGGVAAIGAGRDHGLAVLDDGTVRAWGYNEAGQLGDGTTVTRTTPVAVSGVGDAQVVAGGRDYSIALVAVDPPNEVIFTDDFSNGMAGWTKVVRITGAATGGNPAGNAAVDVTERQAFAYRQLGASYSTLCMSADVNETQFDTNILLRLKTAGNGPIARVVLDRKGNLRVRSDSARIRTGPLVPLGTGWHTVELCGSIGATSTWDLYRNGVRVLDSWEAPGGTAGVGRVFIGDNRRNTWQARFDNVVVDRAPG